MPKYEDVTEHYLCVQFNLKFVNWYRKTTVSEISQVVADTIKYIWLTALIATVSDTGIVKMIRNYHDKCQNLKKYIKNKKNKSTFDIKLKNFRESTK